jgi:hypothetical protein
MRISAAIEFVRLAAACVVLALDLTSREKIRLLLQSAVVGFVTRGALMRV